LDLTGQLTGLSVGVDGGEGSDVGVVGGNGQGGLSVGFDCGNNVVAVPLDGLWFGFEGDDQWQWRC